MITSVDQILTGELVTLAGDVRVKLDPNDGGFILAQGDQRIALDPMQFAWLFKLSAAVFESAPAMERER